MSIIGAEDEDFENDLNQTVDDQCYYFNSIELLKSRPTHLLVFLHHVMLQFDCAPVLCYLHADMFKNLSAKETKKHFGDFYNSFLDKGAILRVSVPVHVSNELDRTRPELLSEDQQRRYAQEVQNMQTMEVLRQLEDFRQKRMMGMTPNEHELSQVENHYQTDRVPREMKEKAVAEMLLERLLEANSTIFSAVVVYMKHLGVKTRTPDSKKSKGFFKWKVQKALSLCKLFNPDVASLPEGTLTASSSGPSLQQEEVEPRLLELEQDPPNWRELASSEVLSKLSKKEMKRQEVINELFATEHAHVRMLSVLQTVFYRPLEREEIMSTTELDAIFPSLDDIIDLHYTFYENLKRLRQEDGFVVKTISTPLLNRFNGSEGDWFQKLAARFCSHQSWALDLIKSRQKKDPRFNAFILDAESKPQCRRLQLKDIIPIEMQRLTKYPLLLENIAKSTEDNAERENIQQAAECCRKILNHVNEEVKYMENLLTLKDYQRRLDTSGLKPSNELYLEYKNFDLTTRSMLYEGALTWRVTKEKAIDVQGVLLGDLLVLLQKQDDKMLLKCQSKSIIAAQEGKQMLSPIIKLDSAFLREVATDRKAFYVIFTWDSGAQIYELVAHLKEILFFLSSRLQPPLSPIENGADPLKNNAGKNFLTDEKSRHSQASVIDYLAANGFDPLGHSNAPPEKSASGALDEVTSLKRMLVGSISLSEDTQPDGENGGGSAKQDTDTDGSQSLEEHSTEGQEEEEHGKVKIEEVTAVAAPLVLSHESMKEVCRKLDSLEDKLKKLQVRVCQ
uniref:DH domain-containing protein n=1 Tax=Pygocentrus nattereri TaxID=42514 RepID=A0AAR2KKT7_PYGNA